MTFDPLFLNPVWSSLSDNLAPFAHNIDGAKRFDPAVLPFVAVPDRSQRSSAQLDEITNAGDDIYLVGVIPPLSSQWQLRYEGQIAQMVFDGQPSQHKSTRESQRLAHDQADDMLALTRVAYPGFFRARTHEVGEFFGLYRDGQLVSMLGTRMQFAHYCEITTICTHPDHTGKGYSSFLVNQMVQRIQSQGRIAFLHVDCSNTHAMVIYHHCGFREFNRVPMQHVARES